MALWDCCLLQFTTVVPVRRCHSSCVGSANTRNRCIEFSPFHISGSLLERPQPLWKAHFYKWSDTKSAWLLESRRTAEAKTPVWLNYQRRLVWLRLQMTTTLDLKLPKSEVKVAPRSVQVVSSSLDEELQHLCKKGQLERALDVVFRMDQQGIVPSVETYRSLCTACTKKKALVQAKQVHAHLARHGLESTRHLGESVVKTLVKCGGLEDALQVFNGLLNRSVVSWTALISGYTMGGQGQEALRMYQLMREEGVVPDSYTFVSVVKACGMMGDLGMGKHIHAEALRYRYVADLFVGTCLVDMYAKCGSIMDAQNVFEGLSEQSLVSWTTMLMAYAQQGLPEKALQLYGEMSENSIVPGKLTFMRVIQSCGMLAEKEEQVVVGRSMKVKSLKMGKAVHADARRKGHDADGFVGHTLISMYGKCQSMLDAQHVFDGLTQRDVVSWTGIIAAYASSQQDVAEKAIQLYGHMLEDGVSPNDRTFVSVLQACAILAEKEDISEDGASTTLVTNNIRQIVKAIHAIACIKGHVWDVYVSSSLISMYGKCGNVLEAIDIFERLPHRNLVSWNSMVAVYTLNGQADHALELYAQMQEKGVSPDSWTFVSALQACGDLGKTEDEVILWCGRQVKPLEKGMAIHADACRKGCDLELFVGNSLICMYAKCSSLVDARKVFDAMSNRGRDIVSWNTMLSAYVEQGQGETTLQLFREMQEQKGLEPDEITLTSVLQACSQTGSLKVCTQIHSLAVAVSASSSHWSSPLASTLIHTYARCSSMLNAQKVFDALPQPDVVAWTTLIAGYARQGDSSSSLDCFRKMQAVGVKPNGATFLALLCACSHAGLVDRGVDYLESMTRDHGLHPGIEHYVSMVDLLGRAGHFDAVQTLLATMPLQPSPALWLCLLGACRKHRKVELGKQAFEQAVQLQPRQSAAYVLMCNIYADAGLWECVEEVEVLERKMGAWTKPPGQSWVEHEQGVQTFVVGDRKHPQQDQLDILWGKLRKV